MQYHQQAHVTDVCLLPFQKSQWVPTGNTLIDQRIEQYYINKEDELDETIEGRRIIGIKIGNPKRYDTAQLFELHQRLEKLNVDNAYVHLEVAEKYFDESAVAALRCTLKQINYQDINQLLKRGHIDRLDNHERSQLIPSLHAEDIEAFEWQKEHTEVHQFRVVLYDDLTEIVPFLLAAPPTSRLLFIRYQPHDSRRTVLSRAGDEITYQMSIQAILFDVIHYGLQYQLTPLIVMRGDQPHRLTTYGEAIKIEGRPYLLQTPHIDLFAAVRRPFAIDLTDDAYQIYMDYYRRPFTIMLYQPALPLYYEVKMLKEWL